MWTLLLLAATVRSFAHMPLEISDRNSTDIAFESYLQWWLFGTFNLSISVMSKANLVLMEQQ